MTIKTDMAKEIIEYLMPVWYDPNSQWIFFKDKNQSDQVVCEIRGWGKIHTLMGEEKGAKFQDELGYFVAQSINFGMMHLMQQETAKKLKEKREEK